MLDVSHALGFGLAALQEISVSTQPHSIAQQFNNKLLILIMEQLWALVHSTSLPPGNGIDFHSLFVAQTLYLPSKAA